MNLHSLPLDVSASRRRTSFFPGLVTGRFYETWDFYTTHFGFRTLSESDTYVHLEHPDGLQLGILQHEHDGPPPELICATDGRGFWLTLEVGDADVEYERLRAAGVTIVSPPEDKPRGKRHFVVRDPNGVLIYVAHRTTAPAEAEAHTCTYV